ncbi:MAG: HD domain-containing protein, partial [Bdellovibrionales bacterium]|nr:HD domain-containing protein [Bdellovibrionales bacterium]
MSNNKEKPVTSISFADVVNQTITFSRAISAEKLVLDLIDTRWFQRMRGIAQTGNTNLVYMFSEHSRFGHSVGVAHLACQLVERLSRQNPERVEQYRSAVCAAALLHDIGHIAPGSHAAYKTWFPSAPDVHEDLSVKLIKSDSQLQSVFDANAPSSAELVCKILIESEDLPAWTWQIISGGGWNVDRGNWCIVDSVMAGVNYGRYNIPALVESIVITDSGQLA